MLFLRILQQDRILFHGEAPQTICVKQNRLYLTFHQSGGEYIPRTVERRSLHSLISLFLGGLWHQGVCGFGACVWHLCYWWATWQLRSRPSLSLSVSPELSHCAVALLYNVQLRIGVVWWETSAPLLQNPLITWFCLCITFFISQQCEKKSPDTHKLCPNDNRGNTITGNTFTTNHALSPQWLVLHANQNW